MRHLYVTVRDRRDRTVRDILLRGHRCHNNGYRQPGLLCARGAGAGRPSVPAEGVPDAARHAAGKAPYGPPDAAQRVLVVLQEPNIILQLRWGYLDVPRVPEHPPDETQEDDDGARVDQQVIEKHVDKHPDEENDQSHDVKDYSEPEAGHASAQAPIVRFHFTVRSAG